MEPVGPSLMFAENLEEAIICAYFLITPLPSDILKFCKKCFYLPLSAFKQCPQIDDELFEGKNYSSSSCADKALV